MPTLTDIPVNGSTFREASRFVPSVLSVAPTEEPVAVQEAKRQCRVDGPDEDDELTGFILTAREAVEFDAEIRLITQTRIQYLDYFPSGPIELRDPPVQSVSSITYTDTAGTTQTLSASNYDTDLNARPAVIIPSYGNFWPSCREKLKSIAVTFVCGYGAASAVPQAAKHAMLLRIASLYRDREMSKQDMMSYENLIAKLAWRRF